MVSGTGRAYSAEHQRMISDDTAALCRSCIQRTVVWKIQIQNSTAGFTTEVCVRHGIGIESGHRAVQLQQPPLSGHLAQIAVHRAETQLWHLRLQPLIDHFRCGMFPACIDRLVDLLSLVGKASFVFTAVYLLKASSEFVLQD